MNSKFIPTLFVTLIGGTALSTAAFAQSSEEFIAQGDNCGALAALTTEQPDQLDPNWRSESATIVQAADQEQCLVYYDQATTALASAEAGEEMDAEGGRIVVTQPDPSVTVQQDAPEVAVSQPEPDVTVRQGQPEIIVRQAEPTVRVQIPQPVITIDQPQPEIIVRMPEPEVGVTTPEPQVQISQNEPNIAVEQAEPQVQVQLPDPDVDVDGQTEADVTVDQGQAIVRQEATEGTANVDIQQQQPSVAYESAEPNVVFEDSPDPRVEYTESGEPNIRYEDADQQAMAEDMPSANQSAEADPMISLRQGQTPMQAGAPEPHPVSDIAGMPVLGSDGAELGDVDRLVTDGERNYAVLTEGGFLGLGEREVALPLDALVVSEDRLVVNGMTEEDIDALPDFDMAAVEPIGDDFDVTISTQ